METNDPMSGWGWVGYLATTLTVWAFLLIVGTLVLTFIVGIVWPLVKPKDRE